MHNCNIVVWLIVMVSITSAAHAGSFTDNGNGTITDADTGMVWQKSDDGSTRTWEAAISYCEGLSLAGQTDWRLPNVRELKTVVDNTIEYPAINTTYFPNTQSANYWSSTTSVRNTAMAWGVSFDYVKVDNYYKIATFYARCVRGGS